MTVLLTRIIARLIPPALPTGGRLFADRRGAVAITFALSAMTIIIAIGAGIDIGRSYLERQKLSAAATLTCQYSDRPSVLKTAYGNSASGGGQAAYVSQVKRYLDYALTSNNFTLAQTNSTPFTYVQGGAADVTLSASVPTLLMGLAGVQNVSIGVTVHCYDSPAKTPPVPDATTTTLVSESFENSPYSGTGYAFFKPDGSVGTSANPSPTPNPGVVGYVGSGNNAWITTGYCLETDSVGVISSSVPDGTHSAELDCDNGGGSAGNSSISTKVYLQAKSYELRWNYRARVGYYDYFPAYICGSTASDVSWASSANSERGSVVKTNQINVYLDKDSNGTPPLHTTLDGTQTLAGTNLIDTCIYSAYWLERTVKITVATAGYYWLSFAADGASDSYGGQIDNLRLCSTSCSGTPADSFPQNWTSANNGGNNVTLFGDNFESPQYSYTSGYPYNPNGNLGVSYGTSGSSSGWPFQAQSGWATGATNAVFYMLSSSAQGNQSVQLDYNTNKLISRPFLLTPGYYQVSYYYAANELFPSLSGTYCGTTPTAANVSALSGSTTYPSTYRALGSSSGNLPRDTGMIASFMSHAQLASTPILNTTYNSTTSYLNPNGTTTTTPTVPPNGISLTSYNASQVNPLLDICGYASTWQARSRSIKIVKPAYYWLTLSALGTADSNGGAIDDVKLIALGGLSMVNPPSNPVTIPVPDPQPGATISFTGFSIVAGSQ